MMKPLLPRVLFLSALYFLCLPAIAQKQFRLTIQFPQTINPGKVEAWFNNGKEVAKIQPLSVRGRQMVLVGDYYSLYAAITLQYPPDSSRKGFAKEFFVGEKPGTIRFNVSRSGDSPFDSYSLQQVLDFENEKKQLDDYSGAERKKAMDYEARYGDTLFSSDNPAMRNYYFQVLRPALGRKKMEYIIASPGSYYSFYIFRTEVAKPAIAPWDSLLLVFNKFPGRFKYSDEGNYLNAFLRGRLLKQKSEAIDFTAKDIHKNVVRLSQYKGKKIVLLHFWATWCTPCIKELPALKEISDQYKGEDLQIISIALPSTYPVFLATIKKYQMNWIHLYNNPALVNQYGNEPTPRICLVDKTGKLVYDNIGLGKDNDFQLGELKGKLKEVVGN